MESDLQEEKKTLAQDKSSKSHLVIGAGNLGLDLELELKRQGFSVDVYSLSRGGRDVTHLEALTKAINGNYGTIWYCVGFGSVDSVKAEPLKARSILVGVPEYIISVADPKTRLVFFSSDYAANEVNVVDPYDYATPPRSQYAALKIELEKLVRDNKRPLTVAIRVGSLYGQHKRENTFPGKVLRNRKAILARKQLPINRVTPTATRWLAETLVSNMSKIFSNNGALIHHCAPMGNVCIRDWALMILDESTLSIRFNQSYYDTERPRFSSLACSFAITPYWSDVWYIYGQNIAFKKEVDE